jgi:hypothetical protein
VAFDYANCTKDQLDEYAAGMLLNLDLRKNLSTLIEEVKAFESKTPVASITGVAEANKPKFLRHPVNKRVFPYTDALHEYGLIPCDENGVNR